MLQGANWQRGGGKGDKPKPIERPKDSSTVSSIKTAEQLTAMRKRLVQEKQRRAKQK